MLFRDIHQKHTVAGQGSLVSDLHDFFIVKFAINLNYFFLAGKKSEHISGDCFVPPLVIQFMEHFFGIEIGIQITIHFVNDDKGILHLLKYPLLAQFRYAEKFIPESTDDNGQDGCGGKDGYDVKGKVKQEHQDQGGNDHEL